MRRDNDSRLNNITSLDNYRWAVCFKKSVELNEVLPYKVFVKMMRIEIFFLQIIFLIIFMSNLYYVRCWIIMKKTYGYNFENIGKPKKYLTHYFAEKYLLLFQRKKKQSLTRICMFFLLETAVLLFLINFPIWTFFFSLDWMNMENEKVIVVKV